MNWKELFKHLSHYFYFVWILALCPVNSYGHVRTVNSPNHFFLGKLEQAANQYFMHIHSLVTDCWQAILMTYHTLFFSKIRKDVPKFVVCCSRD